MKTDQIRNQIKKALKRENKTKYLFNALNTMSSLQIGRPLNNNEMQSYLSLIQAYIQYIPDVIDQAEAMAKKEGCIDKVSPLLTKIADYFLKPNDFIPDELGLAGLMDDAYLSHLYLAKISELLEEKTGKKIFSDNASKITQFIRNLIGEPIATNIDNYVNGESFDEILIKIMAYANAGNYAGFGSSFNDYAINQQVNTQMDLITSSYSPSW